MAEFTSSAVTNPAPNILANIPGAIAQGQTLQANALANIGTQQSLDNAQAFRDNTAGLISRDPTATATALGANPNAAISYLQSIPQMDQNTRAQAQSDLAASSSAAGIILNAPPDQRAQLWPTLRQQLVAGGHKNVPPEQYPGDGAMVMMRGLGLTAQEQFEKQTQALTATPQAPLTAVPGGGYVGPDGSSTPPAGSPPGPGASASPGSSAIQAPLAQSESSNNPSAVNSQGYAGTYQFGTGRLTDLGMYQPAPGENPNSNSWRGTLSISGFPQVKTLADFRATPAAQDAAYTAHIDNIDQTIAATPGAQNFDQSGLEAVAHLGGVAGMQKFVATGGKYNPADANGTTLADYYNKFKSAAPAQAPVQVAANTPSASGQPVATDAAPAPNPPGFDAMRAGLYAPAPPSAPIVGNQSGAVTMPQPQQAQRGMADPSTQAGSQPVFPKSSEDFSAKAPGQAPPLNALATLPEQAPAATPASNGLASAPLTAQNPDAGKTPLFQGNTYAPVPGMDGYIRARDANGNPTTMRMPGLPPAKGVETKFVGGTMVQIDPTTGQVVRTVPNAVPDSSRQTSVQGTNSYGTPGTLLFQDGKQVGFVPASTQPIQMAAYQSDLARSGQVAQQATDAEQQIQRALEARNYAAGLPTGAGGEDRAALSTWLKTYAPDSVYQGFVKSGWLPDAPQAEAAAKVMLGQAALDEKTMGGSGGLGLTEKYAKANPSLNMTPPAIAAMSNLKAVTAQSAADYANGYLNYFKQNSDSFTNGGKYQPAADFDQAWHSQPNVQTYLAAIDAMNGKPYAEWSNGLSPQVQQRALGVISRIDPTTVVNGAKGRILVSGLQQTGQGAPASSAPPVGTVQAGYRFNGGDPSSPSSWARVQ